MKIWLSSKRSLRNSQKVLFFWNILSLIFFPSVNLCAGERDPREKSTKTAWILSVLPINGPALIYSGHPLQGTTLTILEAFGLFFITQGLVRGCGTAEDVGECKMWRNISIGSGFGLWSPIWVYSLVRAPLYVEEYNRKIRENRPLVSSWIRIGNDNGRNTKSFGVAIRF